jgi:hypothetical protein
MQPVKVAARSAGEIFEERTGTRLKWIGDIANTKLEPTYLAYENYLLVFQTAHRSRRAFIHLIVRDP